MTKIFTEQEKIIRRKAKRIERAEIRLQYIKEDYTDYLPDFMKENFIKDINEILLYLKNDDKEINKWNYDNYNG